MKKKIKDGKFIQKNNRRSLVDLMYKKISSCVHAVESFLWTVADVIEIERKLRK